MPRSSVTMPVRCAALLACLLPGLLLLAMLWIVPIGGGVVGWTPERSMRGFANLWAAGNQALSGNLDPLFDPAAWKLRLLELYGPRFTAEHVWGYPPTMLLLAVPFALLPTVPSFLAWTVLGPIALFLVLRRAGVPVAYCVAVLLSPAMLENALAGQTGAFAAALLFGALTLWKSNPVKSGLMLGLLSAKPQIGLLTPICLAARGGWQAFIAAALACLFLVILTGEVFGWEAWWRFATETSGFMRAKLSMPWQGEPWQVNFSSPLYAVIALGGGLSLAWAVQAAFTVAAIGACWVAARRGGDPLLLAGFAAALELLASPYSHNYDMTILACAVVAIVLASGRGSPLRGWEKAALSLAWIWPGVPVALLLFGLPAVAWTGPVLCVASSVGVAFCAWQRIASNGENARIGGYQDDR